MKLIPTFCLGGLLIFLASFGCCEDVKMEPEKKMIQGKIVSADWVASKITVRRLEFDVGPFDEEITLTVADEVPITKGTESISFADLKQEDRVNIQYRDESGDTETALRIEVRESL